ncbi:MAG TPA: aminoglycoside phosphotransferase family protein [Anaerolineae bacterium]|nr:aminoglycoside phosphotransferase family protein [Anaerolineae bacterium]HQH37153.1 aminoglycoside phosphotransferase family protein [Anaerolineae bacterium]
MQTVKAMAQHFVNTTGPITNIQEYGAGNIHHTFLVSLHGGPPFILQQINQRVFKQPEWIMRNIRTFTDHVQMRRQSDPPSARRWETPQIIPTNAGCDYVIDAQGGFWRALTFIGGARTYAKIQDVHHAREVGYALGRFHHLTRDLNPARLYDTLEGYHLTPRYLAHYDAVVARGEFAADSADVAYGIRFLADRRDAIPVLEEARQQGRLHLRPTHGDPKVDNVMIDDNTGQAVSIIDLDTVKPGLVHYDIGDCLRSGCNPPGEETEDIDAVYFEMDLCQAILQGYFPLVRDFYTDDDYAYLYAAIRLLALEQGLRFFTDYLEGNVYYKVKHDRHNLIRALVQFKLVVSIEAQEAAIRAVIANCRAASV